MERDFIRLCFRPQLLFQYPVSQSQPAPFYVGGPMGGIDSMAGTEPQQAPPPAPMTPAPPPSTSSCSAGPSPSSQGSETSFDCTHCGKSLRSRKNYSKHMFIHSGKTRLLLLHLPISLFSFFPNNIFYINNQSNDVENMSVRFHHPVGSAQCPLERLFQWRLSRKERTARSYKKCYRRSQG